MTWLRRHGDFQNVDDVLRSMLDHYKRDEEMTLAPRDQALILAHTLIGHVERLTGKPVSPPASGETAGGGLVSLSPPGNFEDAS